jgi:cytochrome P450 family 135
MPAHDSHTHLKTLPPTAPLPAILQTLACRLRPLEYLHWCRDRIGARFTVQPTLMPPLVFLSDPAEIRATVTAPLDVLHGGKGAELTAPLFGYGSFLLRDEDDYLALRNTITPAFHNHLVNDHRPMVNALATQQVESWPVDQVIQTYPWIASITMAVILRTVFTDGTPSQNELHCGILRMLEVAPSLVLQEPHLRHLPGWRSTWRQFIAARGRVDELLARIIRRRKAEPRGHGDLLEMLLEAGQISDSELRDNLVSIIVAGHETTASTLAWAVQLIAHHPRVQERLIGELDVGGDEYLAATINEVIRHRPVFLFTPPRAVHRPIEIGGWTYHPPVHLLGCTYLMHHAPELFANPRVFRPERFLEAPRQTTWLPWGGGRKVCPGRHLAVLELRVVLRAILSRWWLAPASATMERPRWRSALVTPHAGSTVILQTRRRATGGRTY